MGVSRKELLANGAKRHPDPAGDAKTAKNFSRKDAKTAKNFSRKDAKGAKNFSRKDAKTAKNFSRKDAKGRKAHLAQRIFRARPNGQGPGGQRPEGHPSLRKRGDGLRRP